MSKLSNSMLAAIMIASALLLSAGSAMLPNPTAGSRILPVAAAVAAFIIGIQFSRSGLFGVFLKSAPWLAGGLLLTLFLTRFTPLGYSVNGSMRYFYLPWGGFRFTPALLSMPILCLLWARYAPPAISEVSAKRYLFLLLTVLVVAALVFVEPFISMSAMILIFGLILLFLGKPRRDFLILCVAVFVLIGAAAVPAAMDHLPLEGLKNFYQHPFSPDSQTQYHTWSLFTTLKHSTFIGKHHIPETITHHIPNAAYSAPLAAGCGEYGFIFLSAAFLLMGTVIACGIAITVRSRNSAARLLSGGMTASIALPTIINSAMMFGLLPVGGIGFPFLSPGGTAAFANFFALGIIAAMAIQTDRTIKARTEVE